MSRRNSTMFNLEIVMKGKKTISWLYSHDLKLFNRNKRVV